MGRRGSNLWRLHKTNVRRRRSVLPTQPQARSRICYVFYVRLSSIYNNGKENSICFKSQSQSHEYLHDMEISKLSHTWGLENSFPFSVMLPIVFANKNIPLIKSIIHTAFLSIFSAHSSCCRSCKGLNKLSLAIRFFSLTKLSNKSSHF